MAMAGRIARELEETRRWEGSRDVQTLDGNVRRWTGLLLPVRARGEATGGTEGVGVSEHGGHAGPGGTLGTGAVSNNPPYNTGAFRFELTFSPSHPLEPPSLVLRTPIYHPSVDLEGRVCQPLTSRTHWEPRTRAVQVLQELLLQLDSPDPQRVLRPDVARELQERPEEFRLRAEEFTQRHAEPRAEPRS